jgi:redox-sensitive bicupin YhaK (pirin superfamily)
MPAFTFVSGRPRDIGAFTVRRTLPSAAPGDVNWMTAGRGIVHSERTGAERRKSGSPMHGIQSWVALPTELEETAPAFQHVDGKDLPGDDVEFIPLPD